MKSAAIIVAAGRGTRAGSGLPKQWRELKGRSLVAWSLEAFRSHPDVGHCVLVLHPDDIDMAPGYEAHGDVTVVAGGDSRAASVMAGLVKLEGRGVSHVLIHDAARPLASHGVIDRVLTALKRSQGAAPALAIVDALWRGAEGVVAGTEDRRGLYRAQTPQGFAYPVILAAPRAHTGSAADDVEVARAAGIDVAIVEGEERNLKITTAADFDRAAQFLKDDMDIRTGNGFDVHRFAPGDHVMLCGLKLPHSQGLDGHSDADVGMHALTDALYGALAEGDIGRHFPPSDPQWKGADSAVFLDHAAGRATARGFRIANADVTLICEAPKIGPHAPDMAQELARIMGIEADRVSVKATTSERLGFTGREEGIAAIATVTLVQA